MFVSCSYSIMPKTIPPVVTMLTFSELLFVQLFCCLTMLMLLTRGISMWTWFYDSQAQTFCMFRREWIWWIVWGQQTWFWWQCWFNNSSKVGSIWEAWQLFFYKSNYPNFATIHDFFLMFLTCCNLSCWSLIWFCLVIGSGETVGGSEHAVATENVS